MEVWPPLPFRQQPLEVAGPGVDGSPALKQVPGGGDALIFNAHCWWNPWGSQASCVDIAGNLLGPQATQGMTVAELGTH